MIVRTAAEDARLLMRVVLDPSRLELVIGADALPDGDRRILLRRASSADITATAASELVNAIRIVIAPGELAKLGPKVGVGAESARLSWCEDLIFELEVRWKPIEGADPLAGAAHAVRERLRLVFDLVGVLERGTSCLVLGAFPWLEEATRPPKRPVPISPTSERGRLAVRFRVSPWYRSMEEDLGTWYKLYDTGIVERRRGATVDDDGTADGGGSILETRARTIGELAKRPLAIRGNDVEYEWQVYGPLGTLVAQHSCSTNSDMGGPGYSVTPLLYELASLTYVCR